MCEGRKQVRLFGLNCLENLYPNPLGSQGKTIQSQVNLDHPNLEQCPLFESADCSYTILQPGEMLFIPGKTAFYNGIRFSKMP